MKHPVHPCLWFDGQARAAADFYCALFPNSNVLADSGLVVTWELDGQRFMGLNGGPQFTFTPATSFVIECDSQEEVDRYWHGLMGENGNESMCGWLVDNFGVSWQVVSTRLHELLGDPDPEKQQRVTQAMLQMRKLDIAALEAAYNNQND